jgi:hypothetical protein
VIIALAVGIIIAGILLGLLTKSKTQTMPASSKIKVFIAFES